MPIPDAQRAVVEEAKVRDYLLNLSHPDGGSKAHWFHSLGYQHDKWQDLADDLIAIAQNCATFDTENTRFGVKRQGVGYGRALRKPPRCGFDGLDRRRQCSPTASNCVPGMTDMIAEHSLVVLDAEPPHEKLTRGDVGTVVHVYKGGVGYEVEFVDGGGQTIALVTVGSDDVRPIGAGELLHTRKTV
jgi:hypothetical protein